MTKRTSRLPLFPWIVGILLLASSPSLAADAGCTTQGGPHQVQYKGLILAAFPPPDDVEPDFATITEKEGVESLKAAVDLIHRTSPFSVKALEKLQANGRVMIVYQPTFRAARNGMFTLAAFYPDFYKRDDSKGCKDFVVLVGRHGVKWPTQELAMILVHELVGHGIQHLNGWLETVREIDLECNANLYAERFYQDVGIDKHSREVVQFRRSLESHWCADFRIYMRGQNPELMGLWDVLNPDVPKLMTTFNAYIAYLQKTGVAGQAIGAAKEQRMREIDQGVRRQAMAGDADAQYRLALLYRDGLGLPQNPAEAAGWFLRSAQQGDARAQTEIGILYATGKGIAQDIKQAFAWLGKAAATGDARAKRLIEQIKAQLSPDHPALRSP